MLPDHQPDGQRRHVRHLASPLSYSRPSAEPDCPQGKCDSAIAADGCAFLSHISLSSEFVVIFFCPVTLLEYFLCSTVTFWNKQCTAVQETSEAAFTFS